ncbi:MAG: phosphoserine phosphatase SerB [Alphaproteobacteria bacterium]|jgi:phosphoserine phosphatase|nr:phosphoserine phosphatase SerB [Alphaproteobacteria bacterium]MBT4019523.1 phosphoserine phosphatase SerB [Alphaproteobacteria bacterium]MBT4967345.1 phosphoserine phosphatase SerB [Alphaproteobacteria bacterium]MBT5159709.1 phosphoserine phosphatase SerB [Alphaproteobacteria bacterium]MBT5918048.1 phosphoserine phosphatase SerB [Alphaproteobacteria bacterium]
MENVLTLIGSRSWAPLSDDLVAMAIGALEEAGAECSAPDWLSEHLACDIFFDGFSPSVGEASVRQYLRDMPVDIISQHQEYRRKKLLLSDMDSTIIEQECIDEVAAYAGLRDQVSEITEAAMRGELDFSASLVRRAAMLKDIDVEVLQKVYKERITVTPGARTLVQTMRKNGAWSKLVSGGFTYFTNLVSIETGFHDHQANRLEVIAGRLTGKVIPPILDNLAKRKALDKCVDALGLQGQETLAVGDGANDIPMLQEAGLGIAFHAKPLVAASSNARLDHADLTGALYAQGYRDEEFVLD